MPVRAFLLAGVATLFAACGGDGSDDFERPEEPGAYDIVPLVTTSQQVTGINRFTFQLLDRDSQNVPDAEVALRTSYIESGDSRLGQPVEASYLPLELEALGTEIDHEHPDGSLHVHSVPFGSGIYVATIEFDRAGEWGIEVSIDAEGSDETVPLVVTVLAEGTTPGPGDAAPRTRNHTLADLPIEELSSDASPDLSLYETTLAELLDSGMPVVLAFATPGFCHSRVCTPVLDNVKQVKGRHPGVGFIHIEPFENLTDPLNLVDSPFSAEWGLPNEPWVFVIDSSGIVRAAFEGPFSVNELEAAIEAVQ